MDFLEYLLVFSIIDIVYLIVTFNLLLLGFQRNGALLLLDLIIELQERNLAQYGHSVSV